MQFSMTVEMDNAAFDADSRGELARILRRAARDLDDDVTATAGRMRDINGNTVGSWEIR